MSSTEKTFFATYYVPPSRKAYPQLSVEMEQTRASKHPWETNFLHGSSLWTQFPLQELQEAWDERLIPRSGSACHCYVASKDQALVSEQVIYVEGRFVDDTKRMQRVGELDVKYCTGFKVDDEIQKMASHIKTFELVGCALKRRFPYEIWKDHS